MSWRSSRQFASHYLKLTVPRTGMVWLKDASCFEALIPFREAMEIVAGLNDAPTWIGGDCGLEDGSSPGEWRLPSLADWVAMMSDAGLLNCTGAFAPTITNDAGTHCWAQGVGENSFVDIKSDHYWGADNSWGQVNGAHLGLDSIFSSTDDKMTMGAYIWPVRSGQ